MFPPLLAYLHTGLLCPEQNVTWLLALLDISISGFCVLVSCVPLELGNKPIIIYSMLSFLQYAELLTNPNLIFLYMYFLMLNLHTGIQISGMQKKNDADIPGSNDWKHLARTQWCPMVLSESPILASVLSSPVLLPMFKIDSFSLVQRLLTREYKYYEKYFTE